MKTATIKDTNGNLPMKKMAKTKRQKGYFMELFDHLIEANYKILHKILNINEGESAVAVSINDIGKPIKQLKGNEAKLTC